MSKTMLLACSLLFYFIVQSDAARILAVFPIPSISHQVVFRPLTQDLARRGHEVVVVTPDPAFQRGQAPEHLTEIDVHEISYDQWKSFVHTANGKKDDLSIQLEVAFDLIMKVFEKQIQDKEFNELLFKKNCSFDLLLIEACAKPALSLSHIYKVPVILVSSFGGIIGNYEIFGSPNHPMLYPLPLRQKIYNLTIWEKLSELYKEYQLRQMIQYQEQKEDKALTRIFGLDFPGLSKLTENIHMLFLNIHPIWDNNRPVPPSIMYMGGLHQKPQKPLPKDLSHSLDSSSQGVIYFSLGTNVNPSFLPEEKLNIFRKVFSQLPYTVLWKWAKNESHNMPNNVNVKKWFPQSDLLRHPNIRLFITQGGLQSTDEAITAGVPLIGIPMLGDQWFNVEKYEHYKIGVKLDLETLTENTLMAAIKNVMSNKSYRENISRLRSLMHDQLVSPLEKAVWWTEHILRHKGGRHLQTPASNLSWMEYYELKLLTLLLGILVFTIFACFVLIKVLWRIISKYKFISKFKSE